MRKNAEIVLMAFAEGKPKNGQTIHTDGKNLYSYNMLIARKNQADGIDLLEYNKGPSRITKSHIRAVEEFFAAATIDSRVASFEKGT